LSSAVNTGAIESPWRTTLLLGCLLAATAVYLTIYHHAGLGELGRLRNLVAVLCGMVPYLLAVAVAEWVGRGNAASFLIVAAGAVLLQLCTPWPGLIASDDAQRYLWDGLVQSHGINPYLYPPQSEALATWHDSPFYPQIYRPEMKTVYPPFAQLYFVISYLISPTNMVGLKLLLAASQLASTLLLAKLLRADGQSADRALLYAWSPLCVSQLGADGHLDGLLVPWLLLALHSAERRPVGSGVALGLSAMIRPLTVLCLPALAFKRNARETLLLCFGFVAICTVAILPYLEAGAGLIESLIVYSQNWCFNSSLYRIPALVWGNAPAFRPVLYGVIVLCACAASRLPVKRATACTCALGTYFSLAPTVYPWYLISVNALAALRLSAFVLALPLLVSLADLVFVSGAVGGAWEVPPAVLVLEYGCLYSLLFWEFIRWRS
jgi:hypothetical protein